MNRPANFVATEPRQITGAPFYYYGYTGKLDAGHLIWNSLTRCCEKKHRGAKAASNCAKKAACRRNEITSSRRYKKPMRQKQVFTSNEIAHVWANEGASQGRCPSHMSFDGPAFYSYATVIARILKHKGERVYVVDGASVSMSTARHQGAVRAAIPEGATVFHVECGSFGQTLRFTPARLRDHYLDRRGKVDTTSRYAFKRAEGVLERRDLLVEATRVAEVFGLGTAKFRKLAEKNEELVAAAGKLLGEIAAKRQAAREARAKAEHESYVARAISFAERLLVDKSLLDQAPYGLESLLESRPALLETVTKLRLERDAKAIEAWRLGAHGRVAGDYNWPTMLRRDADNMETSKGARVPIADARRAYFFAVNQRAKGWRRNGDQYKIGMYDLDAVNEQGVVAGCHRVSWDEIERFAAEQGWTKVEATVSEA